MPHAVIQGKLSAELVHERFAAFREVTGDLVLHARESYLARRKGIVLIEATAIEHGVTRRFLVELLDRDDGVTLRLFSLTDPEKTAGVKQLLVRLTERILALDPSAAVVRTNLPFPDGGR